MLKDAGPVTVILRSENDLITRMKLTRKMPDGWKWGDDIFARYAHSGIKISNKELRVKGSIKR